MNEWMNEWMNNWTTTTNIEYWKNYEIAFHSIKCRNMWFSFFFCGAQTLHNRWPCEHGCTQNFHFPQLQHGLCVFLQTPKFLQQTRRKTKQNIHKKRIVAFNCSRNLYHKQFIVYLVASIVLWVTVYSKRQHFSFVYRFRWPVRPLGPATQTNR
jgi:hypothetical protein